MFLSIKVFCKKHLAPVYPHIRSLLLPLYIKNRGLKLKKFSKEVLFDFNYLDVVFKIYLNPNNGFIDGEIYWKGVYEEEMLSFLKKHLSKGDVYVDVGANIGQHALFASRIVGDTGVVYAFEPNYPVYDQFKRSIVASEIINIKLFNMGLGTQKKDTVLYVNPINKGGSSLIEYSANMEEVKIVIETGDSVLQDLPKVDFVKIDVEGFELEALEGLIKTLQKNKPKILLEFTPIFYNKKNTDDASKIINFLYELGYSIQDLESTHPEKIYSSKEDMNNWLHNLKKDQTNIFCQVYEKNH